MFVVRARKRVSACDRSALRNAKNRGGNVRCGGAVRVLRACIVSALKCRVWLDAIFFFLCAPAKQVEPAMTRSYRFDPTAAEEAKGGAPKKPP